MSGIDSVNNNGVRISIATKLILSFLLIIFVTSAIFTAVIVIFVGNHIKLDAQEQALEDLESAREIYSNKLDQINSVVRSTADRSFMEEVASSGNVERSANELARIRILEALDLLTITDESGQVIYRTSNPDFSGDDKRHDQLVSAIMRYQIPTAATVDITAEDLKKESPLLAAKMSLLLDDSTEATNRGQADELGNMMLAAAAPIFSSDNTFIGVVYGGRLLNGDFDFICDIKQAVFQNTKYSGHDIGFATIYQDDVEILTCPQYGPMAIRSRADKEKISQVERSGIPDTGRELVNDSWYITAYKPIRNAEFETVGILQVGTLEQKYLDIRNQIIVVSVAITISVALIATLFAYFISTRISVPLKKLVSASRDVAEGNLDARVDIKSMSHDELGEVADAFNAMASALKERDETLKGLARTKIRRSERLALIGKLSANVAHELNNPLQGIVTYSHLLLERMPAEHQNIDYVQKIVIQANRCRDIIRGLLDFARQREPDKTLCDVNEVLQDCISLLENQAIFLNIEIIKDFDANLPLAVIDPSQIERVFMNMLINAAEAMDGYGRLTLATRTDPTEDTIEIVISDTGHGIAEEDLRKIFDPFYTTKDVGHGTGLGLAISYGITKEHSGTIAVETAIGSGTTFTITLPVTAEKIKSAENGRQVQITHH